MIGILIYGLKTFAQRGNVCWRKHIIDVIDSLGGFSNLFDINTSSICTSLTLLKRAVEPDYSIETAPNHALGRFFFSSWLD